MNNDSQNTNNAKEHDENTVPVQTGTPAQGNVSKQTENEEEFLNLIEEALKPDEEPEAVPQPQYQYPPPGPAQAVPQPQMVNPGYGYGGVPPQPPVYYANGYVYGQPPQPVSKKKKPFDYVLWAVGGIAACIILGFAVYGAICAFSGSNGASGRSQPYSYYGDGNDGFGGFGNPGNNNDSDSGLKKDRRFSENEFGG